MHSIEIYCNILNRDPCIVIRIVSPDSCQYTALHANGSEPGANECGAEKIVCVGHPDAFKKLNSCERLRTVSIP